MQQDGQISLIRRALALIDRHGSECGELAVSPVERYLDPVQYERELTRVFRRYPWRCAPRPRWRGPAIHSPSTRRACRCCWCAARAGSSTASSTPAGTAVPGLQLPGLASRPAFARGRPCERLHCAARSREQEPGDRRHADPRNADDGKIHQLLEEECRFVLGRTRRRLCAGCVSPVDLRQRCQPRIALWRDRVVCGKVSRRCGGTDRACIVLLTENGRCIPACILYATPCQASVCSGISCCTASLSSCLRVCVSKKAAMA